MKKAKGVEREIMDWANDPFSSANVEETIQKLYLDQYCQLCKNKPVRYVKTIGGF